MGGKLKLRKRIKALQKIVEMENSDIPYSTIAIAKEIGVSKATVSNYRKALRKQGLIEDKRRVANGASWMVSRPLFDEIPVIAKFTERLKLDQLTPTEYTNRLYDICRQTGKHPDQLVESLENAEIIYSSFTEKYKAKNPELMLDRYNRSIRKFISYNQITLPPNSKVMPSGTDSSGEYSRVRLDDDAVQNASDFIEKNYGSDWALLFGIHHEIFARPATMLSWTPNVEFDYVDIDGKSYEHGICTVFEKKTKKRYDKLILLPSLIKQIKELSPNKPIMSGNQDSLSAKYASILREYYYSIDKLEHDVKYKKGVEGWLYQNRPIYAIRHSAALMWMRRTGFNLELVSKMGWDDTKTLSKFYARTTVKNIMQAGVCYYCRPPATITNEKIFCSASHALAYVNGARK